MTQQSSAVQEELRQLASTFLSRECTPSHVRRAWEPDADVDRSLWHAMAELDLLGINIPEAFGGLGLGDGDLVVLLEEAGYAGLPEPLLETAGIVAPIIRDHGTPEQQEQWLPGIVSGDILATVQLTNGGFAPYGATADLVLIEHNDGLHLVAGKDVGVSSVQSMDYARHVAALSVTDYSPSRLPGAALEDARIRAAAAAAAVLNGVSLRMLDMTVSYAKEREQFGRAIGSFQAVKHMLAEIACAVETARPSAWYAAAAIGSGAPDAALSSSAAKAAANAAASLASLHALQVHGGIGFTWEHDLHLWMKKAKVLEESYGSARYHHRLLGAAVLSCTDVVTEFGPALSATGA